MYGPLITLTVTFDMPKVRHSEGSIIRKYQPLSILLPVIRSIIVNSAWVGPFASISAFFHALSSFCILLSDEFANYETYYSHVTTVTDVDNVNHYYKPVALLHTG
jgi:hypothetical protein